MPFTTQNPFFDAHLYAMRSLRTKTAVVLGLMATMLVVACNHDSTVAEDLGTTPIGEETYAAGGGTTVYLNSSLAFSTPASNLSAAHLNTHYLGKDYFDHGFATYGSGPNEGLGPLYIATSCASCHTLGGRSHVPLTANDTTSGLLLRLSISGAGPHGGPLGVPYFGDQLQTRAIAGVQAEGTLDVTFANEVETFPDGHTVILQIPYYTVGNPYYPLPDLYLRSARNASPIYGSGLLDAISNANILALADPEDADADGISGKANIVWDVASQSMRLGRFGWKASQPSLVQQTAGAFNGDMGITSLGIFPTENGDGQPNCVTGFGATPDVDGEYVALTAYYVRTLGVPAPRHLEDPIVKRGQLLFDQLECDKCHTPQFTTGDAEIAELSGQVIYPYTDLLLHDLGVTMGDGRPDFEANSNEWRTAPLWGIGLTKLVNPSATFLHDGRAATLEEAVLWHGGESLTIKNNFKAMPQSDREALIRFLEAL